MLSTETFGVEKTWPCTEVRKEDGLSVKVKVQVEVKYCCFLGWSRTLHGVEHDKVRAFLRRWPEATLANWHTDSTVKMGMMMGSTMGSATGSSL
jgi:hypothetical protein